MPAERASSRCPTARRSTWAPRLGVPGDHRAPRADRRRGRPAAGCAPGALDGRTVLVAGGAGAVGHAAIQLARWAGATVITTISSPEKAALATAAGAHHTSTTAQQRRRRRRSARSRPTASTSSSRSRRARTPRSTWPSSPTTAPIAIYANNGGDRSTFDVRPHMSRSTSATSSCCSTRVGDGRAAGRGRGHRRRAARRRAAGRRGPRAAAAPLPARPDRRRPRRGREGVVGKVLITLD